MYILTRFALLITVLLSFGCATNDMTSFRNTETAWQIAHLIDVGQTVAIAKNPDCYHEANIETATLLGSHPRERDVYKWGVGMAVFHFFTRKWVDDHLDEKVSIGLRSADLGFKTATIVNNHRLGLHIDGTSTNKPLYDAQTGQKKLRPNDGLQYAFCSRKAPDVGTGLTWKF